MSEIQGLQQFLQSSVQQDRAGQKFQLENARMLEINVDGDMWIKLGSMVAYRGNLKFEREGALDHGLGKMLKRAVTGETNPLTRVTGRGVLYVADEGKHITLLSMQNETVHINGHDLLAFEPAIQWDIKWIKRIAGMLAGGLFCLQLNGTGTVALCSHGQPMTLRTSAADPVYTDPNATMVWSGHMFPELKTDINLKTLIGKGSGETFQMCFKDDGFVVVQPYEETPRTTGQS